MKYRGSYMRKPIISYCDNCDEVENGLCTVWADVIANVYVSSTKPECKFKTEERKAA